MRAKKAKKPARSIRYMLSADQRLQKLSLRKIAGRDPKPKRPARPKKPRSTAPVPTLVAAPVEPGTPWSMSTWAALGAVVCVIAAIGLLKTGQPAPRTDAPTENRLLEANAGPEPASNARPEPRKAGVSTPAAPSADASSAGAPSARAAEPVKPVAAATAEPKRPAPESIAKPAPAPSTSTVRSAEPAPAAEPANAAVQNAAPTTITGCLERDGEGFRLKDTSGLDAPKARSWRSGFFRKRSATIDLVDAGNSLRLATHVGRRVSVTGTLDDRELQARSLRIVSASCK